jgi:hypothetical protein
MEQPFIYESLNKLNSNEIVERIKMGHYSDEAKAIAISILNERNIPVPTFDENYSSPKISFYKSHPIWFWTFFSVGITIVTRLIQKIVNSF